MSSTFSSIPEETFGLLHPQNEPNVLNASLSTGPGFEVVTTRRIENKH